MSPARSLTASVLAMAALAACSREAPPPAPEQEDTQVEAAEPAPPPPPPPPVVEAPPPPPVLETNFDEPAPEPIDPSEQTLEDADATGLTTRAAPRMEDEDAPAEGAGGNE
jgi:hypothetical protein